mgnify:CR=1 FL=1
MMIELPARMLETSFSLLFVRKEAKPKYENVAVIESGVVLYRATPFSLSPLFECSKNPKNDLISPISTFSHFFHLPIKTTSDLVTHSIRIHSQTASPPTSSLL